MPDSFESLGLAVALLPGFFVSMVLDGVTDRKPGDTLARISEALGISVIIYTVTLLAVGLPVDSSGNLNRKFLALVIFLMFFLSVVFVISYRFDIHMSILRNLGLTTRTSRHLIWQDIFHDFRRNHVTVCLKDGRRMFGWPEYSSRDADGGMVFLYRPFWIDGDGTPISTEQRGFLIMKDEITWIEVTDVLKDFVHEPEEEKANAREETV